MRILHVLAERGHSGGEEQLRALLEHLVAAGHDNHLVLQPVAKFAETAARLELPVARVRMRNSADPLAWAGLRAVVRRVAPDLVHLACSRSHKLGAVALLGRRGPPRIVTRRLADPLRRPRVARWLYGTAVDHVVGVSRGVVEAVAAVGVPRARISLIEDGVELDRFAHLPPRAAARAQLGVPPEGTVVLCAATLRPRKGQLHLLRAFAEVASEFAGAVLVLAGDGDQKATLAAAAESLGLAARVFLPGRLPIEPCLAAADVCCVPSRFEGLSVFALESMAAGLPVVGSRAGGLPEAIEDTVTGLLVTPGDEPAWADGLRRLLRDPALCRKMGEAGRMRAAARFSARAMAEKTETLYEGLIARRSLTPDPRPPTSDSG